MLEWLGDRKNNVNLIVIFLAKGKEAGQCQAR
jgi:hypothetical protein